MAFCNFAEGAAIYDSTPIENYFLLLYMPVAPEGYLRAYLYARMVALHPELGRDMAEAARALRMDEKALYDAYAYWEKQGLMRRLTDRPPTYELLPVRPEELAASDPTGGGYYEYREFNASLQALFGDKLIESHEYRIANDWLNVLGYDQAAALRLVQYGISRSRSKKPAPAGVFKRMDKVASDWADRGCRTLEDVERAIAQDEGIYAAAQAVLKRFAIHREPTMDELNCARRWVEEWHLSQEEILAACEATTKSRSPSFAYLDAVLKSRQGGDDALWKELTAILQELDPKHAKPTPDEVRRYAVLRSQGFLPETVRLAAVQCRRKNRSRFEDMEWMLTKWGELRLYTPEAAEAYIQDMRRKFVRVRSLLEKSGLDRRPTMDDLSLYDAWGEVHEDALIDFAASCARGMQMPMKYMDKLLAEWSASGIRTVEAAKAQHKAFHASRSVSGSAPENPALDYTQREYKESDFGDDFFIDLDKYGEGGDQE